MRLVRLRHEAVLRRQLVLNCVRLSLGSLIAMLVNDSRWDFARLFLFALALFLAFFIDCGVIGARQAVRVHIVARVVEGLRVTVRG